MKYKMPYSVSTTSFTIILSLALVSVIYCSPEKPETGSYRFINDRLFSDQESKDRESYQQQTVEDARAKVIDEALQKYQTYGQENAAKIQKNKRRPNKIKRLKIVPGPHLSE